MAPHFRHHEVPSTSTKHPAVDDFDELQRDAASKRQRTPERDQQHQDAKKSKALQSGKEDLMKMPQEVLDCIVAWAMPDAVIVVVRSDPKAPSSIVNWEHFNLVLQLMCVNRETMTEVFQYRVKHTVLRVDMMRLLTESRYEHDERNLLLSHIGSLGRAHHTSKPTLGILEHISLDVQELSLSPKLTPAHSHALHSIHLKASCFKADHKLSEYGLNKHHESTFLAGKRILSAHARRRHALKALSPFLRKVWYRPANFNDRLPKICVVLWNLPQTLSLHEKYNIEGEWEHYEHEVPEEQLAA